MEPNRYALPFVASLVICGWTTALEAQGPDVRPTTPAPATPSYSFFPPGARAMGMGGTFLAIADDATASEANPAGLTILSKPEVSAHFRFASLNNAFPNIDATPQTIDSYKDTVVSPSFFSFVYPLEHMAIAGYYQQQSNFKSHARFSGVLTDTDDSGNVLQLNSQDESALDLLNDNLGFSAAFQVAPSISIGGSFRYTRLRIDSSNAFLLTSVLFPQDIALGLADVVSDTGDAFTFNLGLLANPNGKLSGGLVYKHGAEFQLTSVSAVSVCLLCNGVPSTDAFTSDVTMRIPSSYGGGVAWRPTESWVVGLDVLRITYSDNSAEGSLARFAVGGIEPIEDGTEVHAGAEYTWMRGGTPIALRFGLFSDPDHDGIVDVDSSQIHATFGAGVVLKKSFQLDGAVNVANDITELLLSFVVRFP